LQRRLHSSPKVVLCLDEFKQFVNKCKIDNSALLPCVNSLFENNVYENTTQKSRIEILDGHLSMISASTIDTWQNIWTSQFTSIGFNNRLFLVPGRGERKYSFPPSVPQEKINELCSRLLSIISTFNSRTNLEIDSSALEIFDQWYLNLQNSVHSKRLDTYALRFLPLLAVNDDKSEVDTETVIKAIRLCDWQFQVRGLYDPIDADNKMAEMEEKIRRVLSTGAKDERKIKQRTNYQRAGIWFFNTAFSNLKRNNEIRKIRSNKRSEWELVS